MPDQSADPAFHVLTREDGTWLCLAAGFPQADVPDVDEGEPLQSGVTRGAVRSLERDGRTLWVRTCRHGGLWGRILGPLRDWFASTERAERELDILDHLRETGVLVPEPAFAEARPVAGFRRLRVGTWGLGGTSFVIALPAEREARRAVLEAAGREVRAMHDAGVLHGDLHFGNLLWDGERVGILDFDHADLQDSVERRERWWELLRLLRSGYKRISSSGWGPADDRDVVRGYAKGDTAWTEELEARRAELEARVRRHSILWR